MPVSGLLGFPFSPATRNTFSCFCPFPSTQPFTICTCSRSVPMKSSFHAATMNRGALRPARGGRSPPMGTPVAYPIGTKFVWQRFEGKSHPPKKRTIGRVPLVPYVSLRLSPSKMESREFSSAHTTECPPELFWMVDGRSIGQASSSPRCPGQSAVSGCQPMTPVCESDEATTPILKGFTPFHCCCACCRPSFQTSRTYARSLKSVGGMAPLADTPPTPEAVDRLSASRISKLQNSSVVCT